MSNHLEGVQIIKLSKSDTVYLSMLSDHMFDVFKNWMGDMRKNAFYHWLSLFLIQCERLQVGESQETKINERQKLLLNFNQLLENHFKREFKVEFYLSELGLTIKALSRLTKEKYKMSPKAVIDERRLLEIKRLLKGTTNPTKHIAYELGFDEPTNMVKYFKKHTGLTPGAFRVED
jgi:AraC-like DNA-binding protein